MSIAYEAKHQTLKAYPSKCDDGIELFLSICGVSEEDFEFEESESVEIYVYGVAS